MSKVEGGGVRLTPPPSRLRVTIFSRRLLGLTEQLYEMYAYELYSQLGECECKCNNDRIKSNKV